MRRGRRLRNLTHGFDCAAPPGNPEEYRRRAAQPVCAAKGTQRQNRQGSRLHVGIGQSSFNCLEVGVKAAAIRLLLRQQLGKHLPVDRFAHSAPA